MTLQQQSDEESFVRGFHGIPDDEKLKNMSFSELASELSSCKQGSPKFMVIEREMGKHIAKDQAKINLKNIIIGGIMAGLFGLSGVVLGWWLRDTSTTQKPAQSSAVHQVKQSNPNVKQNLTNVAPINPIANQPITVPGQVKSNAQPNQAVTKP